MADIAVTGQTDERFDEVLTDDARSPFTEMALADDFADFLTLSAYERLP